MEYQKLNVTVKATLFTKMYGDINTYVKVNIDCMKGLMSCKGMQKLMWLNSSPHHPLQKNYTKNPNKDLNTVTTLICLVSNSPSIRIQGLEIDISTFPKIFQRPFCNLTTTRSDTCPSKPH